MNRRKKVILGLALALGVGTFGFRASAKPTYLPLSNEVLMDMIPHPGDSSKILVASKGGVYLREEDQRWKRLLSLEGGLRSIRKLVAHPLSSDRIFILTDEGILEYRLGGNQPKLIFQGRDLQENRALTMALHPKDLKRFYVGTERGLFSSQDSGQTWREFFEWPANQPIEFVAFLPSEPPTLLIATQGELFFSNDEGDSFESGFSFPSVSEEGLEEMKEREELLNLVRFSSAAYSLKLPSHLWVGTLEGVFESRNGGIEWEKLPERGLEDSKILGLAFSERSGLVAATSRSIIRFLPRQRRWEKLSVGLVTPAAAIALLPAPEKEEEILFVGGGNQVVEWSVSPIEVPNPEPIDVPSPDRIELFRKLIILEPSVREIQKRAIRYNDLGNGKIKRWQSSSRLRALIPRLAFGKNLSTNNNIDLDRGGTNNPDVFIEGPNEVDRGWDLDLTWELGDLLFSTAQTSIDSRTKLLVELRESLLSQVTRIYFERRRTQMEIVFSPSGKTQQEYFDLLLRLDELTAQIDALTDGFLSRELEKIYEEEPELKGLRSSLN